MRIKARLAISGSILIMKREETSRLGVGWSAWLDLLHTYCTQKDIQLRYASFVNEGPTALQQEVSNEHDRNFGIHGPAIEAWERTEVAQCRNTSPAFATTVVRKLK